MSGWDYLVEQTTYDMFPSRSRAASHFRECGTGTPTAHATVSISFSSGFSFQVHIEALTAFLNNIVSISLSSGFSFQAGACKDVGLSL